MNEAHVTPVTPARPAGSQAPPTEAGREVVRLPGTQRCTGGGGALAGSQGRWQPLPATCCPVCMLLFTTRRALDTLPTPPPLPEGPGTAKLKTLFSELLFGAGLGRPSGSPCARWEEGPQGSRPLRPAPLGAPGGTEWQEKWSSVVPPPPAGLHILALPSV